VGRVGELEAAAAVVRLRGRRVVSKRGAGCECDEEGVADSSATERIGPKSNSGAVAAMRNVRRCSDREA